MAKIRSERKSSMSQKRKALFKKRALVRGPEHPRPLGAYGIDHDPELFGNGSMGGFPSQGRFEKKGS